MVTGVNRLVFTLSCIMICWGTYKLSLNAANIYHVPLIFLGEASYSVYLLHPIVYKGGKMFFERLGWDVGYLIPIGIVITLIASWIVYNYFEKYFMRLGRK